MISTRLTLVALILAASFGCGDSNKKSSTDGGPAQPAATALPADLIVAASPGEAKNISELKKDAKEGDEVIIRGVIGGDRDPFVANRAVVSIIDMTIPTCKDNGEDCPTPWDYCCVPQEELTKAKATIQVVGKDGFPLKIAMNAGQKIKPYDVIVVRGRVGARPAPEVLTINATAIYVEGAKK